MDKFVFMSGRFCGIISLPVNLSFTIALFYSIFPILDRPARNIKLLEESFRLNSLQYTLLKRNDVVALYGIGGTYTDKPINYEVDKIYIRTDKFGAR
jgi:hypothetical protein